LNETKNETKLFCIEEKEEKNLKLQDGTNAIFIKYVVLLSPDESKSKQKFV